MSDHKESCVQSENSLKEARRELADSRVRAEQARKQAQAVMDAAADGIISAGADKIIRSFNSGAETLFGYKADEVLGKPAEILFAPAWRMPANSFMSMLLQKEGEREVLKVGETLALHSSGNEFPLFLTFSMLRDESEPTLFMVARDISARKKAEQKLQRNAGSQKVLNQLLKLSLSRGDLDDLLAQALSEVFTFPWMSSLAKGAILLVDPQDPARLRSAAQQGMDHGAVQRFLAPGAVKAYCGLEPENPDMEVCCLVGEEFAITYCSGPPEAYYSLPILSGGKLLGMMVLYVVQGGHGQHEELGFLESVGHTLAGLIEMRLYEEALIKSEADLRAKQEYLDADLKAAADIQRTFLPQSMPELNEVLLDWKFVPNQHIGGDIFNAYLLDENHLAIYMVDVSGHGVPSGLITVSVHEMLAKHSGHVSRTGPDGREVPLPPMEVMDILCNDYPVERFNKTFSIVYALLDVRSGKMSYASAGHPPPVLLKARGGRECLESTGLIIGLGPLFPYEQKDVLLEPGDKLVFTTDGVEEYENPAGEFYGEERFYELLEREKDRPLSQILDSIWESMMRFGQNTAPRDDVSMLGVTYLGAKAPQNAIDPGL